MSRPGDRLRALAARFCDAETMEGIVDPVVADVQAEYAEALRSGRLWRSRWIRLAGYIICLKTFAAYECGRTGRELKATFDERGVARTLGVALTVTLAATVLCELPFLRAGTPIIWGMYLLPEALTISVPVGLAFTVFSAFNNGAASRRLAIGVLIVAVLGSMAAFVNVAWIVPAANQTFRVSVAGTPVMKGAHELTLTELRRLLVPGTHKPMRVQPPTDSRFLARTYYARCGLAFAPLALSIFALALGTRRRAWTSIAMATVCGLYVGYYFVDVALYPYLTPVAFGWTPNLAVLLAAIILKAPGNRPAQSL